MNRLNKMLSELTLPQKMSHPFCLMPNDNTHARSIRKGVE